MAYSIVREFLPWSRTAETAWRSPAKGDGHVILPILKSQPLFYRACVLAADIGLLEPHLDSTPPSGAQAIRTAQPVC